MFGFRNVSTRSLSIRAIAAAAGLAALGFMAPSAEANPWPWSRSKRSHVVIQPQIVIKSDHRHERHEVCDVVPSDLKLSAYRSRDTVMLFVSGTNRSGGFTTGLTACETRGWQTEVTLRNTPGGGWGTDACADACTPFSVKAALHIRDQAKCLTVRVADRSFEVPIEEVQCLS